MEEYPYLQSFLHGILGFLDWVLEVIFRVSQILWAGVVKGWPVLFVALAVGLLTWFIIELYSRAKRWWQTRR